MQTVKDVLDQAGYLGSVADALHPGQQRQELICWAISRCAVSCIRSRC